VEKELAAHVIHADSVEIEANNVVVLGKHIQNVEAHKE